MHDNTTMHWMARKTTSRRKMVTPPPIPKSAVTMGVTKNHFRNMILTDCHGWLDCSQSGRQFSMTFFQHLWPSIGNNTANVFFQMVKRLWLIRIDQ
ncbi:hypothetical protein TNCV_582211 [Trichonephila clavipes]|nr:hypothetical protein TNCV_582211 [Trichonephila clavipes]